MLSCFVFILVSVVGSIAASDLPSNICSLLRGRTVHEHKIAGRSSILLSGHTNAVNSIQWSQTHGQSHYFTVYMVDNLHLSHSYYILMV